MIRAAWEVETLKLRRSAVARTTAAVLILGTGAATALFTAVGLGGGDGQMALKVRPMLQGEGWHAYLGMLAQILSVATLLAVGVVAAWTVGREFAEGTVTGLWALPTSPASVVLAKLVAVLGGAVLCGFAAVLVSIPLGCAIGLGAPGADAARGAGRALVVTLLTALLSLPVAWVASRWRGYLPGVGALLGLVVVTQIATVAGAGAWFPWAAPGLWAGMGGSEAAADVTGLQLWAAVPVGAVALAATTMWWSRAELC
ncbi:ABC transporter permease [Cellulomonas gilvus]|uniref:ABC transporter permease n=1 Tax=Cellulomonas gilvus (strain ATCC 13127 / NRRL B-14078) TaxID=593907 RepID=F8A3H1_CELGA|nr:ABC transporter permease [Cellulomonas gilvus]AEI10735.1 hypothetical protein Celgi_0209 [Cellulomonas gilvus ATCC 13127]